MRRFRLHKCARASYVAPGRRGTLEEARKSCHACPKTEKVTFLIEWTLSGNHSKVKSRREGTLDSLLH